MKTKLELAALTYKYLDLIVDGYDNGEFEPLFQYLSEDCVLESQWDMTSKVGYDEVVSYLSDKGKTIRNSGCFPDCYIHELVGAEDIEVNECEENNKLYLPGELCLFIEHVADGQRNEMILRIELNEEEKISGISLCAKEYFRYRDFYTYVSLYPCEDEEKMFDTAKIRVSEPYFSEFYLFLGLVGEEFDEYDDLRVPMGKWIEFLEFWKRFCSFETFDEAFEDACGIDYTSYTVKNKNACSILGHSGKNIWENRNNNFHMLDGLIEWTDKYKDAWSHILICGF